MRVAGKSPLARITEALEAAGCRSLGKGQFSVRGMNKTQITLQPSQGPWARLLLPFRAPRILAAQPDAFVNESTAPAGPFKLLPGRRPGTLLAIADLPLDEDSSAFSGAHILSPEVLSAPPVDLGALLPDDCGREFERCIAHFVAEIGTLSRTRQYPPRTLRNGSSKGSKGTEPAVADDESALKDDPLVAALERRGWSVSRGDGALQVKLEGRHFLKYARLRGRETGSLSLDMELADISDWPRLSIDAAVELARRANDRLRLVRLVRRKTDEEISILAQVHLGSLPETTAWLGLALEALHTAALFLAEELPTLASTPVLAGWLLESPFQSAFTR